VSDSFLGPDEHQDFSIGVKLYTVSATEPQRDGLTQARIALVPGVSVVRSIGNRLAHPFDYPRRSGQIRIADGQVNYFDSPPYQPLLRLVELVKKIRGKLIQSPGVSHLSHLA
jgi:hypothetical protein